MQDNAFSHLLPQQQPSNIPLGSPLQQPAPTIGGQATLRGTPDPKIAAQERRAQQAEARAERADARAEAKFQKDMEKDTPKTQPLNVTQERLARINTALENLDDLEKMVKASEMGVGSVVGQESFRAGQDFLGISKFFNQKANDVAGAIEMVQGDLINQVRAEMQDQGAPIGARGADTEKEASRLAASIANLAQTQDEKAFLVGIQRARDYYLRRQQAAQAALQDGQNSAQQNQQQGNATPAGATEWRQGPPPDDSGKFRLGQEQLNDLRDKLANNPNITAADLNAWARVQIGSNLGTDEEVAGAIDEFRRTGQLPGIDYSRADQMRQDEINAQLEARGQGDGSGLSGLITQGMLPLSDEAAGLTGGIAGAFTGGVDGAIQGYLDERDIQREALDRARARYGIVPEIAGAVASPVGAFRAPAFGLRGAAQGAAAGGLAGFGYGDGASESVGNALLFGAGGAIAQPVIGRVLGGDPTRAARQSERADIVGAFERTGVDPIPANIGGPSVNRATSAASQSMLSASDVVGAAQRQQDQFADAVRGQASAAGQKLAPDDAGEVIRKAGQNFSKKERTRIGRLYDRAAERAKGVTIQPSQGVAQIDEEIARLGTLTETNAGDIRELEKLKRDISKGISIQGIRDARTSLSQGVYNGKLRSNQQQAAMKRILNALSNDVEAGLRSAGKADALNMYRAADSNWAERLDFIDNTLEPIIGKGKSGESIVKAVEAMAEGKGRGVRKLGQLMRTLPPKERGDIQATIIDRMAASKPGSQNAANDAVSSDLFLTNWSKLSEKGKAALFPDATHRQALNDLALVSEKLKQTGRYANSSNTGGVVVNALASGATVGAFTSGLSILPIALGALNVGIGKLLSSPAVARWMAKAPKNANPAATRAWLRQVDNVAKASPAISGEIKALQQALADAYSASPGRLAASEDEGNRRPEPPQQ